MRDRIPIVNLGADTPVDELRPLLNTLQRGTLRAILEMTTPRRRVDVMHAWMGISRERWARESGISATNIGRWTGAYTQGNYRMPFGAAIRLTRVIGVEPDLLFEAYL